MLVMVVSLQRSGAGVMEPERHISIATMYRTWASTNGMVPRLLPTKKRSAPRKSSVRRPRGDAGVAGRRGGRARLGGSIGSIAMLSLVPELNPGRADLAGGETSPVSAFPPNSRDACLL